MSVPPEYDGNSSNHFLLHAALAAGLYPKILAIDPIDRKSIKTVANGQACHFHPSSVNSKSSLDFRGNHMVYFTLMYVRSLPTTDRPTKHYAGILRSFMPGKPVQWMTLL
jgi:ATP-dependent RNA helicase DHX29